MRRRARFLVPFLIVAVLVTAAVYARERRHDPTVAAVVVSALANESLDRPWMVHLERMDRALAAHNVTSAVFAWRDAYAVALGSRRWDAVLDIGDGVLRMATTQGERRIARIQAEDLYLLALIRADRQSSLDGILRAAQAFADVDDAERTEQAFRLAGRLVERDPAAYSPLRLRSFREDLVARVEAARPTSDPRWLAVLLPDAISGF